MVDLVAGTLGTWTVPVTALLVSVLALVVSAAAAYNAWLSRRASETSSAQAVAATHRATAPVVKVECDGTVVRGIEMTVQSNRDLDRLRLELQREPVQMFDRADFEVIRELYMDRMLVDAEFGPRHVELRKVEAGRVYWFTLLPKDAPDGPRQFVRAQFRATATIDGVEPWVSAHAIPKTLLRRKY